jgi:hypothetical protein
MRAMLMTAVGGPDVLQLAELPDPQITSEHDVRVRLHAAGINPVDYKLRSGGTIGGSLPAILGWDGAGVVESVGPAVTRVRVGDGVYLCDGGFGPTPGTYAELKVLDERYVAHKPERLSFVEAAAAPLVTITAWEALRERARVAEHQYVLVQAGAGGVGHMAIQIARLAGAQVATTVTPGPKAELAASLGAELWQPARLLHLDARAFSVRMARAARASAGDPRPGSRPLRCGRSADRGRCHVCSRACGGCPPGHGSRRDRGQDGSHLRVSSIASPQSTGRARLSGTRHEGSPNRRSSADASRALWRARRLRSGPAGSRWLSTRSDEMTTWTAR